MNLSQISHARHMPRLNRQGSHRLDWRLRVVRVVMRAMSGGRTPIALTAQLSHCQESVTISPPSEQVMPVQVQAGTFSDQPWKELLLANSLQFSTAFRRSRRDCTAEGRRQRRSGIGQHPLSARLYQKAPRSSPLCEAEPNSQAPGSCAHRQRPAPLPRRSAGLGPEAGQPRARLPCCSEV